MPLPIPPTSSPAQHASGTSFYPAHLVALQPLPVSPPVAAATYAPLMWPVAAPGQSLHAVPPQHFAPPSHVVPPSPVSAALPDATAISGTGVAQDAQSILSAQEDDRASDPNLPVYSSAAGSQVGIRPSASSTPIPNSEFGPQPALSLSAFAAIATPLPPSPAPSPTPPPVSVLPTRSAEAEPSIQRPTSATPPPVPLVTPANPESLLSSQPISLADAPLLPVSPPQLSINVSRTPSLTVSILSTSTNDSLPPAQIVFTPPTLISPYNGAISRRWSKTEEANRKSWTAARDPCEEAEEEADASCSPPRPLPLELDFWLPEVGLGLDLDLGFGGLTTAAAVPEPLVDTASYFPSLRYGANDFVREVRVDGEGRLAYPERSSSPAAMFGAVEEEDEDVDGVSSSHSTPNRKGDLMISLSFPGDADDLLEAFDAATSFVTSFREADLARAKQDPNHTERTERWLLQQGLTSAKPLEAYKALPKTNDEALALDTKENHGQSAKSGSNGVSTASISPDLLSRSRRALCPLPSSSASPSGSPTHPCTGSALPNPFLLRTMRESTEKDDNGSDGPPSPIETSIGYNEPSTLSGGGGTGRFGLGTKAPVKEEPLTGDKGETPSEIAAMFGNG
ncbi:hypothetical protein JCM1841_004450 [Sporobolomyces salmonicolor]